MAAFAYFEFQPNNELLGPEDAVIRMLVDRRNRGDVKGGPEETDWKPIPWGDDRKLYVQDSSSRENFCRSGQHG